MPTGATDPVAPDCGSPEETASTPTGGTDPVEAWYLSVPERSPPFARVPIGSADVGHQPTMDAAASRAQVETEFDDVIVRTQPTDCSVPPMETADKSVEMFDIRTPPSQRIFLKFVCPDTNRNWHWDVETEEWFFEDEAEQNGWAGYECPKTKCRWWMNEKRQTWFWEKRGVLPSARQEASIPS